MANGSRKADRTNDQGPDMSVWKRILTGVVAISIVALTVAVAISLALQDLPIGIQAPSPVVQSTPFTPLPLATNTPTQSLVAPASSTPLTIIDPTPILLPETPTTEPTLPVATSPPPPPPPTVPVCRPPAGWVPYTVRPGDTLVSLAYRYRTSVSQLMHASCLTSQVLYVGQVVYVPSVVVTPTPRPPCGPPPNWVWYTVQPGDTLYSLSVRTRTTVYAIVQANCLGGFTIYVGQQLWLPSLPPPPPATFTPPASSTATPTLVTTPTPGADTPTPTAILSPMPGDTPTPTEAPGQTPTSTLTPTGVPADTPTLPATATPTPLPPPPTPTSPPPPTPTVLPPTPTSPPPTNTPVPFPTPSGG